jgi:hypothetical protein
MSYMAGLYKEIWQRFQLCTINVHDYSRDFLRTSGFQANIISSYHKGYIPQRIHTTRIPTTIWYG